MLTVNIPVTPLLPDEFDGDAPTIDIPVKEDTYFNIKGVDDMVVKYKSVQPLARDVVAMIGGEKVETAAIILQANCGGDPTRLAGVDFPLVSRLEDLPELRHVVATIRGIGFKQNVFGQPIR